MFSYALLSIGRNIVVIFSSRHPFHIKNTSVYNIADPVIIITVFVWILLDDFYLPSTTAIRRRRRLFSGLVFVQLNVV